MNWNLCKLLAGAFFAAAVAHGTAQAQQATIKFLHIPGSTTYLPMYVGVEKGYFAAENIKLELIAANSAAAINTAMVTGDVDSTHHALSFWATLTQQGVEVNVMGVFWYVGRYLVVADKDTTTPHIGRGKTTWREVLQAMKGKTVGTVGGGLRADTIGMFRLAGMNAEKDLTLVDLNNAAAQVAAMDQGQIDAMVTTAAFAYTMISAKKSHLAIDLISQGPPEHKGAMLTMIGIRKAALAQAPDLADRYTRALAKSAAFIKDPRNMAELIALCARYGIKVDTTVMPELLRLAQRDISTTVSRKDAELAMQWAVSAGQIKQAVPVANIITRGMVN